MSEEYCKHDERPYQCAICLNERITSLESKLSQAEQDRDAMKAKNAKLQADFDHHISSCPGYSAQSQKNRLAIRDEIIAKRDRELDETTIQLDALTEANARMREALGKYGTHSHLCAHYHHTVKNCDCGYSQALSLPELYAEYIRRYISTP